MADVRWIELSVFADPRGVLTAAESGKELPFELKRAYWLSQIAGERGNHAHREAELVQVAVAGSFRVEVTDGRESRSFKLKSPRRGLYIPPGVWVHLTDASPDARALILASTPFDEAKVMRDWEEYLRLPGPP